MRAALLLLTMLLGGCAYPRLPTGEDQVGSIAWVYKHADHFVEVAEMDLERCQATGKRTCIPEEQSLHQAKMMQEAAGYSAMLKAGFLQ